MKHREWTRISALFMAMLLLGVAFVPSVSAKAESSAWGAKLLESKGVTVNDFETTITHYDKVGDQIIYSGDFKIDVEKNINGTLERIKSKGTFKGVVDADGSAHIEYSGNGFKSNTDIVKLGTANGNTTYKVSEVVTHKGQTKKLARTVEVPEIKVEGKTDSEAYGADDVHMASTNKVDLPSCAPWGAILVFNDVQYADILAGGVIAAAILAYFGTPGVIAAIIVAVGYAIPEWLDVDIHDIYVDIFWVWYLLYGMYSEVDYYYV